MWTKENISDQTGRLYIVTGGNKGIGYEISKALFEKGAIVVSAGRDDVQVQESALSIEALGGNGKIIPAHLDLGNYSSIESFALSMAKLNLPIEGLINNAGIMMPPPSLSDDGHELQFGVNFLGHFALTIRLLPLIDPDHGRVITMSSGAHMQSKGIDYSNLKLQKDYDANREYNQSKLANMIFVYELQRRLAESNSRVISVGAHPGVVRTALQRHMDPGILEVAFAKFQEVMEPWQGALPALYAATAPIVLGGDYYGPDGEGELSGYPKSSTRVSELAKDPTAGKHLWSYAEQATALTFPH